MRPERIRGNVFVANLPLRLTEEELAELFDPYGIVLRAHLVRDPDTGESRGHGLVELAPDRVVDGAIEAVGARAVGGRRIHVRRADPSMSVTLKMPARDRVWRPSSGPARAQRWRSSSLA
ncbi:MAG: hypothetical protein JOZ05_02490 [Acetobacteraceae bacterium]|nr:hypothetical protein [Acetobacteraceae bacterium]